MQNWTEGIFYASDFYYFEKTPKKSYKIEQKEYFVFDSYYIGKFINKEQWGFATLFVAAQDVKLDFVFGPYPVLSLTGLL